MENQAELCETYQLKWSSYNTFMHSCISTSLNQADSCTDVALITTDGHQIMAHRFVLSYSSLFLAQVLRMQRKVTTALPIMIVMPPEIDHRSLKVLVRYMYSGEAKVSKEILQSVLRGGDILQIKGLYREKEDNEKNVKITQQTNQKDPTPASTPTPPLTSQSIAAPVQNTPVTIANSAKPNTNNTSKHTNKTNSSTVNVPKEKQKSSNSSKIPASPKFLVVQKPKEIQSYGGAVKPKVLNFTIMQTFDKNGQLSKEETAGAKKMTILNKSIDSTNGDEEVVIKTEPKESNLQYLMIKDEPIEWCETDMELLESKEVYDEITIKSENTGNDDSESNEEEFSPLTCELCTETFTIPADWVKHVQTHTDMLPAKRRRRDSTGDSYENDSFPELMCDLCQKPFPTPAEWVQHIQKTHTEFELHLSNKKNPSGKAPLASKQPQPSTSESSYKKMCTDCNKSFPSHASMVIHQRKHTGEKPYGCEYCSKSFNVKSNLLRHLRTLHNKIISSTEIDISDSSN